VCVVVPSIVVVWMLLIPIGGHLATSFLDMLKDLVLLSLGLALYGAVFAYVGGALKRPLVVGLAFIFGWEPITMALPGYLKRFTISYYLQGLVPQAMPNDSAVSLVQSIFREIPPLGTSLVWMGTMEVVFLWLAMWVVSSREYVLEQ
jgi:hypothetical protein